jgi:hypothetical protein
MSPRGIYRWVSFVWRKLGLHEGRKRSMAREDAVQEEEFGERWGMTGGPRVSAAGDVGRVTVRDLGVNGPGTKWSLGRFGSPRPFSYIFYSFSFSFSFF